MFECQIVKAKVSYESINTTLETINNLPASKTRRTFLLPAWKWYALAWNFGLYLENEERALWQILMKRCAVRQYLCNYTRILMHRRRLKEVIQIIKKSFVCT